VAILAARAGGRLCSRRARRNAPAPPGPAASSRPAAAVRRGRRAAVGLGGDEASQVGAGPVVEPDGPAGLCVGRDLRGAWVVAVGGDPLRLPARLGGQHLLVCARVPLPPVPGEPAGDEARAAVRPAMEPGWLSPLGGGRAVGSDLPRGRPALCRRAPGGAVVSGVRRLGRRLRRARSHAGGGRARHPERRGGDVLRARCARGLHHRLRVAAVLRAGARAGAGRFRAPAAQRAARRWRPGSSAPSR
jgi:hypothetical protein